MTEAKDIVIIFEVELERKQRISIVEATECLVIYCRLDIV